MKQVGDLAAFDIDNPSGRFMLNLSRAVDRLFAIRLQASGSAGYHVISIFHFDIDGREERSILVCLMTDIP